MAASALALGAGGVALAASSGETGRIGPHNRIQPNGRKLHPAGKLTKLGNHPYGGGLTPNGRFLWTLSAGRGINDIRIVAATGKRRGRVVQKLVMPGLSGGLAFDPTRHVAYVSGVQASPHTDERPPPSVPGQQGDVIQVLRYSGKTGKARYAGLIPVPPPAGAPPYQGFPPNSTATESWPQDLAISHNGKTLLASLNLADAATVIDTRTKAVRYVRVGHYPYGAAIDRAGHGFVTSETQGTVSEINLSSATKVRDIQIGTHLSHNEGMTMDPKLPRAYVAITAEDQIGVINTTTGTVERTLSVARPHGNGTEPVRVSVTPNGCYLLSADAGEDALAVFAVPNAHGKTCRSHGGKRPRRWQLVGRIPTAAYPVAAQVSGRGQLAWVAAKGLGVGPNPQGPNPNSPFDSNNFINHFQYLPSIVRGESGILRFPSLRGLRRLTPKADRELIPTDSEKPPRRTPLRPGGPIKHVFYIVKENRTYDQVLGDMKRGDGDPRLTLFGRNVTPNLHALAARFGLLDHVYADSEASVDGHYWTAAGEVPDYVIRNWHQNYAGRGRPYDFGAYEVSAPPKGYLFERLLTAGIPFFNYGEALAGLAPFPDKDRTAAETLTGTRVLANSDVQLNSGCYDSDAAMFQSLSAPPVDVYDSSLPPGANPLAHSRFDCFKSRFEAELGSSSVPAFNYLVLPLDHTQGVSPGTRTPTADIADNDWALGQIVDLISHSPIWKSSLILVQEDDSQDGADHVDAHRIPALAISPYTRKGAVVPTRYDQLSILRTAERVLGLHPKYLAEDLAVPMYDAFTSKPRNSAPYNAIVPNIDMTATNANTPANRRASGGLNLSLPDRVPQRRLDAILWRFRHGPHSVPPPPGPNASSSDTGRVDRGG
jgi:Phosphoesterase family